MLILALHAPSTAAAGDIAVVVHPRLPLDNLSLNEVRKVVLGDQQFWNGNRRVTLLLRAPVAREREVVLKKVCQMNEAQFRKYWIAKVFRAEAVEGPKVVYSNETALQLVQSLPGAIAFVDADQIPRGLKVLRVDGRLPGETSYPLR